MVPDDSPGRAYTVGMSRIFWVGVGAAGGIMVYRKTTRAVDEVRDRTFRENLSLVARTASNVAASARYLAALSTQDRRDDVIDLREGAPVGYYTPQRL
jgi:hypothetical protein